MNGANFVKIIVIFNLLNIKKYKYYCYFSIRVLDGLKIIKISNY